MIQGEEDLAQSGNVRIWSDDLYFEEAWLYSPGNDWPIPSEASERTTNRVAPYQSALLLVPTVNGVVRLFCLHKQQIPVSSTCSPVSRNQLTMVVSSSVRLLD